MDWESILKFLLGVATISGALAFIGKKIVEMFLAAKIEKYKSNLEKIAIEHSTRFQKLHSERAEAIKMLYEKLVDLDLSLNSTLKSFQAEGELHLEEKVKKLSKVHNEIYFFYLPKKIFFEKEICSLLDEIFKKSKEVFIDITAYPVDPQDRQYKYSPELLKERHEFWERARGSYQKEISQLIEKLEDKFRKIMGIDA